MSAESLRSRYECSKPSRSLKVTGENTVSSGNYFNILYNLR